MTDSGNHAENSGNSENSVLTPFNMVAGMILIVGIVVTILRFTKGLGSVTNLSDYNPWGIWIGFDLLVGVALAAGGYVTSAAVYIFGMKRYHSAVRPAVLTGFLGYALVVVALHYDVGRPWRLPYPFIIQQGTTSVLFEVGACVALYLSVLFLEYSPAALEWLGIRKLRDILVKITMVLTIFGVMLLTFLLFRVGCGGVFQTPVVGFQFLTAFLQFGQFFLPNSVLLLVVRLGLYFRNGLRMARPELLMEGGFVGKLLQQFSHAVLVFAQFLLQPFNLAFQPLHFRGRAGGRGRRGRFWRYGLRLHGSFRLLIFVGRRETGRGRALRTNSGQRRRR